MKKYIYSVFILISMSNNAYSVEETSKPWSLDLELLRSNQKELISQSDLSYILAPYYYNNISGQINNGAESSSGSTDSNGFSIGIKYTFKKFDFGFSYYDLGESDLTFERKFYNSTYDYTGTGLASGEIDLSGLGIYISKQFKISETIYFSPKIGALNWDISGNINILLDEGPNGSASWELPGVADDGTDIYFGTLLGYRLTKSIGSYVNFQRISVDAYNIDTLSIGLSFSLEE